MSQRLAKWRKWMETITQEVRNLVHFREVFLDTQKIIQNNESIHRASSFYDLLKVGWVSYAAMAVRRQVKAKDGSISFGSLMSEVSSSPRDVNLESYEELYMGCSIPGLARHDFKQFQSSEGAFVNADMVVQDLDNLKQTVRVIEHFADKRLAHRDKGSLKRVGTFDELHASIEILHQLTLKYRLLLLGIGGDTLIPTHQYEWKAIFNVPWIKDASPLLPLTEAERSEWGNQ